MPIANYTQIIPVVDCSDKEQLQTIMTTCSKVRALTYNKLGSLQGWGKDWKKADPIIRKILHPNDLGLPSKIFEWTVSDTFKAITAQQEAAKTWIIRDIYRNTTNSNERKKFTKLLKENPTADNWLHRRFRKHYRKGHTFVNNQVVYQKAGYKAIRLTRSRIKLEIAGLEKGKRITLIIKSQRLPQGQIRVINKNGGLEVHTAFSKEIPDIIGKPEQSLGMDKGYTEGFYLSNGSKVADGLGVLLTKKSERINKENKNRGRLFAHGKNHPDKKVATNIKEFNLGRKVKNRKLQRDKAEITCLIRSSLRQGITVPTQIFVEDLSSPIAGKKRSKRINRLLNQWVKGELQVSVERIAQSTGSTVKTVNPAYTSQVDYLSSTLLGVRNGNCFTRYTGEVLQADYNAANVILSRGTDSEITRYMKYESVRRVLLHRTVRYLHSLGYSVTNALTNGWLQSKFKAEALLVEREYHPLG